LHRLSEIARAAGAAILELYDGNARVERKADQSPVTAADRAAHRVIFEALSAWTPTVPVISEEGQIPPFEDRRDWSCFWLVDPLDGTKEFLSRNGEFTVNIALIQDGEPVLGVVYAPAFDVLFVGGDGLGAWKQEGSGARARIYSTPPPQGAPVTVVESRSHPSAELEEYLRTIPIARRVQAGSSLKFCVVAEGQADIYPRLGPTMEWDVAAGDCVFRNSSRTGQRSSSLTYNKPDLRNSSFVLGWEATNKDNDHAGSAPLEER
jgi:3'(2'), 5'-bisphosphate nucleotidase